MANGPSSFRHSVSRRLPKKIIAPSLLLSSSQPFYIVKIITSLNENNHLITVVGNSALTKKKTNNAQLW